MLLVWLFGAIAGAANGCVLSLTSDQVAHAVVVGHTSSHADGDEDTVSKVNCQDLCDQPSVSVPSQGTALDKTFPGIPVGLVSTVSQVAPTLGLQPRTRGLRNRAPPIPILFLRLTL